MDVGFIGLGSMGAPMAERLLGPDTRLHVHDRDGAAMARLVGLGAVAHDSPASVADVAPCVFACLPSAQASEAVALGEAGIGVGTAVRAYVEMSTLGAQAIERIAAGLNAKSVATVDAPVSGGPAGARAGTLAIMLAGPPEAVALATPWLQRIGNRLFPLGERPGTGQVMKLVNNLVLANTIAGTFEAMVLGARAGLDPATMTDVLNVSTGASWVTTQMVPRTVLSGTFDFGATMAILTKDTSLGIEEARALGVPVWVLEQAARLWQFASAQLGPNEDMTRLLTAIASWAQVDGAFPTAPR